VKAAGAIPNRFRQIAKAVADILIPKRRQLDARSGSTAVSFAQKAAVPWSAPQNGNAYEEVLSDGWSPIRAYWQDTSPATGRASRIPRCNSTCPTTRATSRSIRPSRSISGPIRRPCWRHWGQKRPILPAGEGRGVQARHRERDCALLRYQTFRAGDACPRGRGGHSRLPSLNDNVNRNSPDAS
jgi:hypothetical protein